MGQERSSSGCAGAAGERLGKKTGVGRVSAARKEMKPRARAEDPQQRSQVPNTAGLDANPQAARGGDRVNRRRSQYEWHRLPWGWECEGGSSTLSGWGGWSWGPHVTPPSMPSPSPICIPQTGAIYPSPAADTTLWHGGMGKGPWLAAIPASPGLRGARSSAKRILCSGFSAQDGPSACGASRLSWLHQAGSPAPWHVWQKESPSNNSMAGLDCQLHRPLLAPGGINPLLPPGHCTCCLPLAVGVCTNENHNWSLWHEGTRQQDLGRSLNLSKHGHPSTPSHNAPLLGLPQCSLPTALWVINSPLLSTGSSELCPATSCLTTGERTERGRDLPKVTWTQWQCWG